MLWLPVALLALSLLLGLIAWRGRRIDDHPVCRRCGFDLIAHVGKLGACPECGSGLLKRVSHLGLMRSPTRVGNRARSKPLLALAACLGVVSLAGTGGAVWLQTRGTSINSQKPTWLLLREAGGTRAEKVAPVAAELEKRAIAGRLTPDQKKKAIALALQWQADESKPWIDDWGDLIEGEWDGLLTPEQQKQYARHAAALVVQARDKVRQGERVPAIVQVQTRIGGKGLFSFELRLPAMTLGDQQLLSDPFAAQGTLERTTAPSTIEMAFAPVQEYPGDEFSSPRQDAAVGAAPGPYMLKLPWHVRITQRTGGPGISYSWGRGSPSMFRSKRAPVLAEFDLTLERPVEVVAPDKDTVELVTDESLMSQVRTGLSISIVDQPAMSFMDAHRTVSISIPSSPLDIAYDVELRSTSGVQHGFAVMSASSMMSPGFSITRQKSDTRYRVVLKPAPARARTTVGMKRIAGAEIVLDEVPVTTGFSGIVAPGFPASAGSEFATMAVCKMADADPNRAFRSVALRMPAVYAEDRDGNLNVFDVAESDRDQTKEPVTVIRAVGDGNDLKIVGDVLLCSRNGNLEAYSLKDPLHPEHLGRFGHAERTESTSILIDRNTAVLVGRRGVVRYDVSDPEEPRTTLSDEVEGWPWAGCLVGDLLYASEVEKSQIVVYDLSQTPPRKLSSLKTPEAAYAIHKLSSGKLLACLDAGQGAPFTGGARGTCLLLDVSDPASPKIVSETEGAGGRCTALVTDGGEDFLVCPGAIMRVTDSGPETVEPLYSSGSNVDGQPYHGAADGKHAALALHDVVIVVKRTGSTSSPK